MLWKMISAPSGLPSLKERQDHQMSNVNISKWIQQCGAYAVGACDGLKISAGVVQRARLWRAHRQPGAISALYYSIESWVLIFVTAFDVCLQIVRPSVAIVHNNYQEGSSRYVKLGKIRNSPAQPRGLTKISALTASSKCSA